MADPKLAQEILSQVPSWFWALIGLLILTNLGAVLTVFGFVFKAGKFVANTENGIKDAKDCGVRAHKRITRIVEINGIVDPEG